MKYVTPLDQFFAQTQTAQDVARGDDVRVPIMFLDDLHQATTRSDVLGVYSVWAQRLVTADRCSIALGDQSGRLTSTVMNGTKGIATGPEQDLSGTLLGLVYSRKRLLYLPDIGKVDLPDTKAVYQLGYRSAVLAPIVTGQTCFGTLNVTFKGPIAEPTKTTAMIQAMARCLAIQLLVIEQMQNLSRMAHSDALTGAGNRRYLYQEGEAAWVDWKESGRPFAFLSADVDYFKQINDTYGHDVGDAVLCAFVQRMRSRSRASDKVIRLGGEEFGLLMRGANIGMATGRASRLCDVVGATPFSISGIELTVTASFGVTEVFGSDEAFEDVMKRADLALYEAKASGRDQVVALAQEELAA